VQAKVKQVFGKDPHQGVNPDEVVAVGAAIQSGVLRGEVKDVLLLDVTPLSLGVETQGAVMTVLIPRNTTIPTRKGETFSTAADGQTQVEIHVLQGERPLAGENKSLGRFILDGIPPSPRGTPQIEVSFDIDANGILNVSARDKATGRAQQITIQSSSGLSREEIDRMVREAESHAEEDRRKREEAEARNLADSTVYSAERTLRDYGDRVSPDQRSSVESKIEAVRTATSGNDVPQMRRASQDLQQALNLVGQAIYGSPASSVHPGDEYGQQPGSPPPPPDSGTVEGEYREI
jgi:molecular chaperone DnaK